MKKKIITGLLLLISLSAIAITVAHVRGLVFVSKPQALNTEVPEQLKPRIKKYDPALLARLDEALRTFIKSQYTIAGNIDMINKADTTEKGNTEFLLCKNGDNYFYKTNHNEALVLDSICININPETKKVFIKKGKAGGVLNIVDIDQLKRALQTEEYDLISKKNGSVETISLLNEQHVSCKEYAVAFDTISHQLTGIFYRLANAREPMNKDKEKVIDIRITRCDSLADMDIRAKKDGIIGASGRLTSKYSEYELIHL